MKQFKHKTARLKYLTPREERPTKPDLAAGKRRTKRWQQLRARIIRRYHGLCVYCGKDLSAEVHHIKPATAFPDLFWDEGNLAPLCKRCHGWLETRTTRGEDVESQLRPRMVKLLEELEQ